MFVRELADMTLFHLAFVVQSLDETRRFYADMLGCEVGRSSESWVDFSLFGHQMSAHLRPDAAVAARDGNVALRGGRTVPIPHFGVVLLMDEWERLATKLQGNSATDWIERPTIRSKGKPATFFVRDPSGNALEFKGFHPAP
jgi:extradiol dioxygenase family protein